MAATQKGSLFSALRAITDEVATEKQAATRKQAGGPVPADPGGYQGPTTHPSKDADNQGAEKREGSRASENESDVKDDQGAPSTNNAKDARPGQQDDVQLNIGMTQSATGEDPSVEDDYKDTKDDPGSTHPARTDNKSIDGSKYASYNANQIRDWHTEISNSILADLANGQGPRLDKAAQANTPAAPAPKTQQQVKTIDDMIKAATAAVKSGQVVGTPAAGNADLQAGYELAAQLGLEKAAAQAAVADCLAQTIQDAHLDADLFGAFYTNFTKRAADADESGGEGEDHSKPGDSASGASPAGGLGDDPAGSADPAGSPASGGGAGGGGSLGDLLGGGADPGGLAAGGGGGGAVSQDDALMQLVAALDELGIPLEALAAAGGGAPGAGGPPPGDPGMLGGDLPPDPAAGGMTEGMKLASAAVAFRRSGKYAFKAANDGTPERELRNQMKGYLRELTGSR